MLPLIILNVATTFKWKKKTAEKKMPQSLYACQEWNSNCCGMFAD